MNKSSPKIAVFYDWLNHPYGGAEKVLTDILTVFPEAHLYTLVYDPAKTKWIPPQTKIFPSLLNLLPFSRSNPIFYTPLYTPVLQHFDFSQYDIIISTTSTIGHHLPVSSKQLFVCYFHNINRYLYQIPPILLKPLLKAYRIVDKNFSRNPNLILCNSKTVQDRIKKYYQRSAKIIHPGIDTNFFIPIPNPQRSYCLVVSRQVPHKNIHLAIKACRILKLPLKIVGSGRFYSHLKKVSSLKTEFLGNIDNHQLLKLYQNCLCLIHPQIEDFGLSSLETQSCGQPVVALALGGATETVIGNQTGIFFQKATVRSLIKALRKLKQVDIDPKACRQNALKFSQKNFMLNFKKTIDTAWKNHIS